MTDPCPSPGQRFLAASPHVPQRRKHSCLWTWAAPGGTPACPRCLRHSHSRAAPSLEMPGAECCPQTAVGGDPCEQSLLALDLKRNTSRLMGQEKPTEAKVVTSGDLGTQKPLGSGDPGLSALPQSWPSVAKVTSQDEAAGPSGQSPVPVGKAWVWRFGSRIGAQVWHPGSWHRWL